jgi:hypothetical protein
VAFRRSPKRRTHKLGLRKFRDFIAEIIFSFAQAFAHFVTSEASNSNGLTDGRNLLGN